MTLRWTHKDLDLWRGSLDLAEATYKATSSFPVEERFGLASQMRRAAVSILSNVAEGAARHSTAEFLNFLNIARGSLAELDAQVILATRLALLRDTPDMVARTERVDRMLTGLIAKLRRDRERSQGRCRVRY
jgi:four helix bundle protein